MKWTPMLVLLLLGVCSMLSGVRLCLQCERIVRLMHEDFVLSEPDALKQIELQKIVDYAYVTFRETSQSRMGVVDFTTLYRARTEYQSEFHRFLKSTTGSTNEAIQIMENGREILAQHLGTFIPDGLCPNKCGLLIRRVLDCTSCLYRAYTCPSPTGQENCGEFPVDVKEGDQAVLDCFLPWHRLLLSKPEYHYSWGSNLKRSDFKVLVVTQDSSVVLNQLHVEEGGTYQCSLQNQTGTVFYKVKFLLSVAALPTNGQNPVVTLPSLHYGHSLKWREALVPVICIVIACCLAASLGLAVLLRAIWKEEKVKRLQEENPLQKLFKDQI
ncbi:izumo sperm-egg fusion protein 1 [Boleophthalmus pectinirostris]|uniref:izumo sperm-egg fusion protein 1 n=1 Tax=Boleophthalmus pectinirostris TaxID=150288 RepID=UPI0024330AFE|nr:izumo sperm-egg fusion protein 1 [Boleophthalmus pectinirostris]